MKTVVVASNNSHKVQEIAEILNFSTWQFKTLRQLKISSNPDENADTFEGNARIKALAAYAASGGRAVLADDSGLEVDALNGAPGVYSARYAGEKSTDAQNNAKLLAKLASVPQSDRTARFVCVLVFIDEDGKETLVRATVEGRIGFEERGENGFGYDPLFLPLAFADNRSFAEATSEEKNAISHRGCALRKLRDILSEN